MLVIHFLSATHDIPQQQYVRPCRDIRSFFLRGYPFSLLTPIPESSNTISLHSNFWGKMEKKLMYENNLILDFYRRENLDASALKLLEYQDEILSKITNNRRSLDKFNFYDYLEIPDSGILALFDYKIFPTLCNPKFSFELKNRKERNLFLRYSAKLLNYSAIVPSINQVPVCGPQDKIFIPDIRVWLVLDVLQNHNFLDRHKNYTYREFWTAIFMAKIYGLLGKNGRQIQEDSTCYGERLCPHIGVFSFYNGESIIDVNQNVFEYIKRLNDILPEELLNKKIFQFEIKSDDEKVRSRIRAQTAVLAGSFTLSEMLELYKGNAGTPKQKRDAWLAKLHCELKSINQELRNIRYEHPWHIDYVRFYRAWPQIIINAQNLAEKKSLTSRFLSHLQAMSLQESFAYVHSIADFYEKISLGVDARRPIMALMISKMPNFYGEIGPLCVTLSEHFDRLIPELRIPLDKFTDFERSIYFPPHSGKIGDTDLQSFYQDQQTEEYMGQLTMLGWALVKDVYSSMQGKDSSSFLGDVNNAENFAEVCDFYESSIKKLYEDLLFYVGTMSNLTTQRDGNQLPTLQDGMPENVWKWIVGESLATFPSYQCLKTLAEKIQVFRQMLGGTENWLRLQEMLLIRNFIQELQETRPDQRIVRINALRRQINSETWREPVPSFEEFYLHRIATSNLDDLFSELAGLHAADQSFENTVSAVATYFSQLQILLRSNAYHQILVNIHGWNYNEFKRDWGMLAIENEPNVPTLPFSRKYVEAFLDAIDRIHAKPFQERWQETKDRFADLHNRKKEIINKYIENILAPYDNVQTIDDAEIWDLIEQLPYAALEIIKRLDRTGSFASVREIFMGYRQDFAHQPAEFVRRVLEHVPPKPSSKLNNLYTSPSLEKPRIIESGIYTDTDSLKAGIWVRNVSLNDLLYPIPSSEPNVSDETAAEDHAETGDTYDEPPAEEYIPTEVDYARVLYQFIKEKNLPDYAATLDIGSLKDLHEWETEFDEWLALADEALYWFPDQVTQWTELTIERIGHIVKQEAYLPAYAKWLIARGEENPDLKPQIQKCLLDNIPQIAGYRYLLPCMEVLLDSTCDDVSMKYALFDAVVKQQVSHDNMIQDSLRLYLDRLNILYNSPALDEEGMPQQSVLKNKPRIELSKIKKACKTYRKVSLQWLIQKVNDLDFIQEIDSFSVLHNGLIIEPSWEKLQTIFSESITPVDRETFLRDKKLAIKYSSLANIKSKIESSNLFYNISIYEVLTDPDSIGIENFANFARVFHQKHPQKNIAYHYAKFLLNYFWDKLGLERDNSEESEEMESPKMLSREKSLVLYERGTIDKIGTFIQNVYRESSDESFRRDQFFLLTKTVLKLTPQTDTIWVHRERAAHVLDTIFGIDRNIDELTTQWGMAFFSVGQRQNIFSFFDRIRAAT